MDAMTRKLWELQNRHPDDRLRLFSEVDRVVGGQRVLYPGSFVDLSASFVWPSVTYVDKDARAERFFADVEGVEEILTEHGRRPGDVEFEFVPGDYSTDLGLRDDYDLLISLYAGFVSEHCTQHVRVGGTLLVNPSHGDAAMASIDDRYELAAVVVAASGDYRVRSEGLDAYLVPKREIEVTKTLLHETGRAIAYTKPAFAYLFTRVR